MNNALSSPWRHVLSEVIKDCGIVEIGYAHVVESTSAIVSRRGERANALLTQRWKILRHITLSPSRIGAIFAGVLVLTTFERGAR